MGPEKEPSIGAVCCRDRDFYFILFLIVQVVGAERMGFKKKKNRFASGCVSHTNTYGEPTHGRDDLFPPLLHTQETVRVRLP